MVEAGKFDKDTFQKIFSLIYRGQEGADIKALAELLDSNKEDANLRALVQSPALEIAVEYAMEREQGDAPLKTVLERHEDPLGAASKVVSLIINKKNFSVRLLTMVIIAGLGFRYTSNACSRFLSLGNTPPDDSGAKPAQGVETR